MAHLLKRAERWSKTMRQDGWRWKERPPHRDLTVEAIKQQEAVGFRLKEDDRAVAVMEKDLQVLDLFLQQSGSELEGSDDKEDDYLRELRQVDTETIDDVMDMMTECLAQKKQAQIKAAEEKHKKLIAACTSCSPSNGSTTGSSNQSCDGEYLKDASPSASISPSSAPASPAAPAAADDAVTPTSAITHYNKGARRASSSRAPSKRASTLSLCSAAVKDEEKEGRSATSSSSTAVLQPLKRSRRRRRVASEPPSCFGGEVRPAASTNQVQHHDGPSRPMLPSSKSTGSSEVMSERSHTAALSSRSMASSSARSDFDPTRLHCLKLHEENVRKRDDSIRNIRAKEDEARNFKARPLPRCMRDIQFMKVVINNAAKPSAVEGPHHAINDKSEEGDVEGSTFPSSARSPSLRMVKGGSVEGTILSRQLEWEEARERKIMEARAMKEESAKAEVKEMPDLSGTRSSWEIAKQKHEEARRKALQQEKEREELEELKKQVMRSRYRHLYGAMTPQGPFVCSSPICGSSSNQKESHHRRKSSSAASSMANNDGQQQSTTLLKGGEVVGAKQEEVDEALDEIDVINGAPAWISTGENTNRQLRHHTTTDDEATLTTQLPLTRLSEVPLNEVQRSLAKQFGIPTEALTTKISLQQEPSMTTMSSPQKLAPHGKIKGTTRPSPHHRRFSSFDSCVQAYTSAGPIGGGKGGGCGRLFGGSSKRTRRLSSDCGNLKKTTNAVGSSSTIWKDDSWKALLNSSIDAMGRGLAGRNRRLNEEVEKRLQEIYDVGLDTIKTVMGSTKTEGVEKIADDEPVETVVDGSINSQPLHQHQHFVSNAAASTGSSTNEIITDDEVSRLINEYAALPPSRSSTEQRIFLSEDREVDVEQGAYSHVDANDNTASIRHETFQQQATNLDDEISQDSRRSFLPSRTQAAPSYPRQAERVSDSNSKLAAMSRLSLQPYERYEQGFVTYFFDPSSTDDKGRFRVHEARDFLPETMFRKQDPGSLREGVTLLLGKHRDVPHLEKVITIMFDRKQFSVEEAQRWWDNNRLRFMS